VHTDEADALMRLADALCGFVRVARAAQEPYAQLLDQAKQAGMDREL
jgi:hypothetical protein